jgi:GT2 family glycosyltransferase
MNISIIIVNYNLADEIDNCLDSFFDIANITKDIKYEVIIVDNNSPDKKLSSIEKKYANNIVSFYYLSENLGFGKACNYGFSKSSGEYILFLNPDTILKENIFEPIISEFQKDESIGIIAPKQQTRAPFFDFSAGFYPNICYEILNLFGIGVFFEGFLINLLSRRHNFKCINVGWILGAAIFIRSELFKELNGFDPDYFMFFEEVDLCRRVKNLGYNIAYCPWLKIHHIGSVSGKKDYTLYTIRTYSSKKIYISKHYKSFYRVIMQSMLYAQLFSQILIWIILMPLNRNKSKQKIKAFIYLVRNKLRII